MPLEWGRIIGYDASRMTFQFTMEDNTTIIDCEISGPAMDQLAGTKGTMPTDREAQFLHLQDAIERVASDLFYEGKPRPCGMIRIFYHHIRQRDIGQILAHVHDQEIETGQGPKPPRREGPVQ
jgi:hypothetical protein